MKWNQKLRAGALQFVLFIGVVIALLLLTFVLLAHTHSLFGKKSELFIKTVKMADMGLDYALAQPMPLNDTLGIDFPFEDQVELKAVKTYWGIYEKYTVTAKAKKNRFVKTVLAGYQGREQLPALYLQDNERPMIIVGKSKIIGNAFLPQQGIRPGNISGHSFYANSLVYGRQLTATKKLPELGQEVRQQIKTLFQNHSLPNSMEELPFSPHLIAQNSFKAPTKILYGEVLQLSGISLTGNIIVKASQHIIVDASSQLQDVVLIAPEISIKDKVIGTFQALATKRIQVGKQCRLDYPSALVIDQATTHTLNLQEAAHPEIIVGSKSIVKGMVLYLGPSEEQQVFHPQIKIEGEAEVHGEVYCEKNLELKGTVIGGVSAHSFIALENGSIYQNHLYNGTINSTELPEQFAGLAVTGREQFKTISKWLY